MRTMAWWFGACLALAGCIPPGGGGGKDDGGVGRLDGGGQGGAGGGFGGFGGGGQGGGVGGQGGGVGGAGGEGGQGGGAGGQGGGAGGQGGGCVPMCDGLQCGPDGCGGECGPGCADGEVCDAGQCSAAGCPDDTFDCGGVCSALIDDPQNCGSCGTTCPTRRTALTQCIDAECYLNCPGMEGLAFSVDFDNDPSHCGACGNECPGADGGQPTCVGGQCQSPCRGAEQVCNGACVDLRDDDAHCGACGNRCGDDPWCDGGECTCGRDLTFCGEGICADLDDDPDNCGACGNVCPRAEGGEALCVRGECQNPCAEGRVMGDVCGGECRDLDSDGEHCGACNVRCNEALAGVRFQGNCQVGGNCFGNGFKCEAAQCGVRVTHTWDVTGGRDASTTCGDVCGAVGLTCAEVPWETCENNNDRWQGIDLDGRLGAGCAIVDSRNGWGPRVLQCDTRVAQDDGHPYYMTRRLMHCECVLAEPVAPADIIDAPGAYPQDGFPANGRDRLLLRLPAGVDLTVDTAGCPDDTVLVLLGPEGQELAANDDADGLGTCSRVSVPGLAAGVYTVVVSGFNNLAVGAYTVNIDW